MYLDSYGHCHGPVPFDLFLSRHVPETPPRDNEHDVRNLEDEKQLHAAALSKGIESVLKDIELIDTSNIPDKQSAQGQNISLHFILYDVTINPSTGRTQLDKIQPGAEAKSQIDPFNDDAPPGHFEPPPGNPLSAAAIQILLHAEETHARQPRVHSFSLLLTSAYFRLIRADRDGLLVTEKRSWKEADAALGYNCLHEFLRRFARLPLALKGFDTFVRPVHPENRAHEIRARQALQKYVPADQRDQPILEIDVPCPTHGLRTFYIWALFPPPREPLRARATRAFHAWDPSREETVFIKDCWRSAAPPARPEADVVRALNAAGVAHVPQLVCGGDVPGQTTATHKWVDEPWNRGRRADVACHPRVHHRLAETLGVPLWLCRSEKHLLEILLDALQGHRGAVTECRTLHRDLSARNIVWDERTGRGFLVDWDLCAPMPPDSHTPDPAVNMLAQQPNSSPRTGTWDFMSIGQLQTPSKLHDVQDDLEALFWVGVYIIVLYFPFDRAHALYILDSVFASASRVDSVPFGGGDKRTFLADPDIFGFALPETPLLREWFEMYRGMLREWVEYQDKLRRWTHIQKQLAEHSEPGATPGHDDAENSDDEPPPKISQPRAPALCDYTRLEKRWTKLLAKRSFKDHGRLDDELHMRPPEEVIAAYRKMNEAEKLTGLTSDGGELQSRSQSMTLRTSAMIDSGRADYIVEAGADGIVDEAVNSGTGIEVDKGRGEEVERASKRQKTS
ncbi:hypothetical protein VTO73DRAFT_6471 [Trametes versicolor]